MGQTKYKLALVALGLLALAGGALLLAGVKDVGLWVTWVGVVGGIPTQYSAANWAITRKSLDMGKGEGGA